MTNSDAAHMPFPADRSPRTGRHAPRRQPAVVLAAWGVLLAVTTAVLLGVLPVAESAFPLLALAALGLAIALITWSHLHHRGTLLAPSSAPSRFAVTIVGILMAVLLANFPDTVGLPVRIGLVLVVPALMVALLAWDDADTVAALREQREA